MLNHQSVLFKFKWNFSSQLWPLLALLKFTSQMSYRLVVLYLRFLASNPKASVIYSKAIRPNTTILTKKLAHAKLPDNATETAVKVPVLAHSTTAPVSLMNSWIWSTIMDLMTNAKLMDSGLEISVLGTPSPFGTSMETLFTILSELQEVVMMAPLSLMELMALSWALQGSNPLGLVEEL